MSIKDFLIQYNEYGALYLYWVFYNANGHIKRPNTGVQEAYTKKSDFCLDNGYRFKTITNFSKRVPKLQSCHKIGDGVNTFKIPTSRIRTFHKAYIKHYFTKSWEDWCERFISRGDLHDGHRKLQQFFISNPEMLNKKEELMKFYEEKVIAYRKCAS